MPTGAQAGAGCTVERERWKLQRAQSSLARRRHKGLVDDGRIWGKSGSAGRDCQVMGEAANGDVQDEAGDDDRPCGRDVEKAKRGQKSVLICWWCKVDRFW
ncbi:hypothetical protein FDECE_18309, partial [Fusarium decemcellulare]